jgi:hypothetical protein
MNTHKFTLAHLERIDPRFFKHIMWREAYNLWIMRRMPRTMAGIIIHREERGQDASHLDNRIAELSRAAKEYAQELDRLGWLVPIERILTTERFRRTYHGKGTSKDQSRG